MMLATTIADARRGGNGRPPIPDYGSRAIPMKHQLNIGATQLMEQHKKRRRPQEAALPFHNTKRLQRGRGRPH